jgi:LysR family transcriptional regulator for metE and metH
LAWQLDSRILRMLLAVAEAPNAAQAAQRLHITPSALSHQMRKAEADLRVTLFDRRGHRIQLTPLGQQLAASARLIVGELEEAERVLERTRRADRPAIRLGGSPYPVQRLLLPRLDPADLSRLDLVERTRSYPLDLAVAAGEVDLALWPSRSVQRGIRAVPLFEDELVAVVAAGHPLAAVPSLAQEEFERQTYVSYSLIVEQGLEDDLLFRPSRRAPGRFQLAETVQAMLDLVRAGLGFTILSRWAVPEEPGLVALPLVEGGARIGWSLLHREAERDPDVLALCERVADALGA